MRTGGTEMIATLDQAYVADARKSDSVVASLEGVHKNYGDIPTLRGVNFQVRAGELVALLGPNGAGKTTAVKLLLGLMPPNAGRVRVFGGDPTNPENRTRTGAMLQVGRVQETLRVREHIDLFSSYYRKPMPARPRCWPSPGSAKSANESSAICQVDSGSVFCLPCRSAAIRIFFFSTNPQLALMSQRGECCGTKSAS
jgi:energy-coupling factor transporter ATP-binding protein EcfA2